jgi:ankyrin repeat protein
VTEELTGEEPAAEEAVAEKRADGAYHRSRGHHRRAEVEAPVTAPITRELHEAVKRGDRHWLEDNRKRYDIDAPNGMGDTALILAAQRGMRAVTEKLLALGADPSVASKDGWTPLHFAAALLYEGIVELLLDNNVDVSMQTDEGETALDVVGKRQGMGEGRAQRAVRELLTGRR